MLELISSLGKSETRKNFLQILNNFTNGILRTILVTEHGKPQAVIMPFEMYQAMQVKLNNYEKSHLLKKKSIWGSKDDIEVSGDLDKHCWTDTHQKWLKKWDDDVGDDVSL